MRTCDDDPEPRISRISRIADFGLVRVLSTQMYLTPTRSSFATPAYMSPEQALGEARIDHRSGLYSAGIVLYEMLTGGVPIRAETPVAVLRGSRTTSRNIPAPDGQSAG